MNEKRKIVLCLCIFIVWGVFLQAQNQSNLFYMKHNPNQIQFQCIADDNPVYTAKLAKEVYALCPPLRSDRFDRRIWRLWGLDMSAYPTDSLIIIGGNGDTGSLVISPKHRLIWMKTYQNSIFGDEVPKSFPAEQYALFYRYLMMDDQEVLHLYNEKHNNTVSIDFRSTVNLILSSYYDALFDVRPQLIKYADNVKFDVLLISRFGLISNLRYDAVSLYIQKEVKAGRQLYFTKYGEKQPKGSNRSDCIVPCSNMIELEKDVASGYKPFRYYIGEATNTYPMPSNESIAAGWLSTWLKLDREDVNNSIIYELYKDLRSDHFQEKTDRFKAQLVKNKYYGYTLVREFLTNPLREMPTLGKIGTNFRAVSRQSDIPLFIEPFTDSYAIDTIRTGEACQVYETGHDDYYFTEIDRPVESPVAGADGYAMILDRTETIYGYVPKSQIRQYTDADLLNDTRYKGAAKSKQGVINDPDSYVNIRKEQNSQSAIIGKLTGQEFCYWELPGNWYIVEIKKGLRGFVYKDRIREKYDSGKWILED